jgi:hypothetical protein
MAFGQQAGPPATNTQLKDLLALLQDAGHIDFRDARGPMGFTQRQAGGRFTRDEAEAFIHQLEAAAEAQAESGSSESTENGSSPPRPADPAAVKPRPKASAPAKSSAEQRAVERMPAEVMAAELQRRGWVVMEP